jgi:predicted hotdog family 3-hydroxylacyl-ACP dehydratase
MKLDRAGIEGCIPHSGSMVLLDSVVQWDAAYIVCSAAAPGAGHPLARRGTVAALVAVEYGAQAAAVHGFLVEPAVPRPGMLAKLSDVQLHAACIPSDRGPLSVKAQLLSRVALGCLYDFHVECAGEPVAQGRLMVSFAAPAAR